WARRESATARHGIGKKGELMGDPTIRRAGLAGAAGAGVIEYLGLIAAVAAVVGGLLVLRPQAVSRRPPVRPLAPFVRILSELAPAPLPRAKRPRPARPRRPVPRPPRPGPLVVPLPTWFGRRRPRELEPSGAAARALQDP